jgi:hypothetical protein
LSSNDNKVTVTGAVTLGLQLGDADVINYGVDGIALVAQAALSYPCSGLSQSAQGTLFAYFKQYGISLALPTSLSLPCDRSVPGITAVATVSLGSLSVLGLTLTGVAVQLTAGSYIGAAGAALHYNNLTISGAVSIDGIAVTLSVSAFHSPDRSDVSVGATMSFTTTFMTAGSLTLTAGMSLFDPGTVRALYRG